MESVCRESPRALAETAARVGGQVRQAAEAVESELQAARQGLPLGRHGLRNFRKWLGWASYRFAAWVNPEVREP